MDRITIALDDGVGSAVRQVAASSGVSLSAWISEAVQAQLRNKLLGDALDEYEAEYGAFTAAELAEAEALFARTPGRYQGD